LKVTISTKWTDCTSDAGNNGSANKCIELLCITAKELLTSQRPQLNNLVFHNTMQTKLKEIANKNPQTKIQQN